MKYRHVIILQQITRHPATAVSCEIRRSVACVVHTVTAVATHTAEKSSVLSDAEWIETLPLSAVVPRTADRTNYPIYVAIKTN